MVRGVFRCCAVLAVGLILGWPIEPAAAQGRADPHVLDVMVFDMNAVSRSQFGTFFATLGDALLDEGRDISFELGILREIPAGAPQTMGSEPDYHAISALGVDAVVLRSITWCPEQQEYAPGMQLRGIPEPHAGCSFGEGFAVSASARDPVIVWLHERGHVLRLFHVTEPDFIMSEHGRKAGRRLTPDHCAGFQRGRR